MTLMKLELVGNVQPKCHKEWVGEFLGVTRCGGHKLTGRALAVVQIFAPKILP